jgi:hypothetical protein
MSILNILWLSNKVDYADIPCQKPNINPLLILFYQTLFSNIIAYSCIQIR